ncbi:hypothetical protein ASPZODRAFT_161463 [Penicilliopsis zonata CBS 506.65]|uniref:Uncharacterized protein n=1 Tax=Penicilliopsis zonata CBS 506.65 TaxID=1073090 RepID=A0A1L9S8P1_9EURO|nr:hypothetical protein ASPZODRAFT_161463 [Penicilliopsis zonata CBS 506.65]OJJ43514.1 hypothetical protein ASPZODRAFT_161463 [Penicilliopsis zonata CBS 506.65]
MPSEAAALRRQWEEPSDVFTVLLIIGGEIIQNALGAVSGDTLTPVTFSFGWAAPLPNLLVINLESGYRRVNRSWTLWASRIHHPILINLDEEVSLVPEIQDHLKEYPEGYGLKRSSYEAPLCVAVYDWDIDVKHPRMPGHPGHDWLGVSIIPFILNGDWGIFLVTAGGTILAYLYGALLQWRKEKWACRKKCPNKDVALKLGNGSQHVVIIRRHPEGLDLEDLAGGQIREHQGGHSNRVMDLLASDRATQVLTCVFAVLWLLLLITSTGITTHTWYLLAVGGLGTMHNLTVAGAPRHPHMLGIPIRPAMGIVHEEEPSVAKPGETHTVQKSAPINIFAEAKVMTTLMELEMVYQGFGKAFLVEFFPGGLQGWEKAWWESNDADSRRNLLQLELQP